MIYINKIKVITQSDTTQQIQPIQRCKHNCTRQGHSLEAVLPKDSEKKEKNSKATNDERGGPAASSTSIPRAWRIPVAAKTHKWQDSKPKLSSTGTETHALGAMRIPWHLRSGWFLSVWLRWNA